MTDGTRLYNYGKEPNTTLRARLREGEFFEATHCAIEMLAGSYGQAVGAEVMETARWVGTLQEAWERRHGDAVALIYRKTAVTHITGNPKANDSHVRQALIDRFGGDSVALAKARKCGTCKGRGHILARAARARCDQPCGECRCSGKVGADGPLVGISGDVWSALCVAVTCLEQKATP